MNEESTDKKKIIEGLIQSGSEITGGVVGAVIGLLFAGPVGVIAGATAGPIISLGAKNVIERIGLEFKKRQISPREEKRIGAVITYSIQKIHTNLNKGIKLREDNFFEKNEGGRSDADEIFEGAVLASQREYQEKKIEYYGNLITNISFDKSCSKEQANHLIKLAEGLSWRQLCILALAGRIEKISLRNTNYIANPTVDNKLSFLLSEVMELYNQSLIVFGTEFLLGVTSITPSKIRLEGVGKHLYNFMELAKISDKEIEEIANLLKV